MSILFYRSTNTHNTVDTILDALMTSNKAKKQHAKKWKKKINTDLTSSRFYLDHPDKKIKSEADALEAWVARAAAKVQKL